MNRGWTIGKKLIVSFVGVACITMLLGIVGYWGATRSYDTINEVGQVRLPSINALRAMETEFQNIRGTFRTLMVPGLDAEMVQRQYRNYEAAADAYRRYWDIYEPLPQTREEAEVWNRFVPAVDNWRRANQRGLEMSRQFDALGIAFPMQLIADLESFTKDHYILVENIRVLMETGRQFDGGDDHNACNFGRWIPTFETDNQNLTAELRGMVEPHRRFHEAAGRIKQMMDQGRQEEARRIFNEAMLPAMEQVFGRFDNMLRVAYEAREIRNQMEEQFMGPITDHMRQALEYLDEIVVINEQVADEEVESGYALVNMVRTTSLIAMIIGVLLALTLGIMIARSISTAIQAIAASLASGGDQVASAANQVSSSSQQMAEGASEQASNLEEVSSSLEEMSSMTRQNADNAQQGNLLMTETGTLVEKGQGSMTRLAAAIEEIKSSADQTAKIVKTIDEIAFQTNLLALNAAVEAARAGEAGKGFAVVAEEVRNLAQRAGEAARNTATLIEGSVKNAERGVEVASETKQSFDDISVSSGKVSGLVAEISAASNEQARGIDQLNEAMSQLDQVTQENAANSEESSSAAEELSAQAKELNDMVKELLAMVDSSAGQDTSFGGHGRSAASGRAPARRQMAIGGPSGHAGTRKMTVAAKAPVGGAINKGKVVKPQDVIPLEDDDFKDF